MQGGSSVQGGRQEALMAMKPLQTVLPGGGAKEILLCSKLVARFLDRKRKKAFKKITICLITETKL